MGAYMIKLSFGDVSPDASGAAVVSLWATTDPQRAADGWEGALRDVRLGEAEAAHFFFSGDYTGIASTSWTLVASI